VQAPGSLLSLARRADPVLAITLLTAFALCLHGITARYLHPDQMALLPLFHPDRPPFDPGWFQKPPFHTYFNYFLSVLPLSILAAASGLPSDEVLLGQVVWSRMLAAGLLLSAAMLVYRVALTSYGVTPARIIAALFATSAGLIAHTHHLTADIPVMFWMVAAFYACRRIMADPRRSSYLIAGLLTGIATATKYNGLGIGVALVAAQLLRVALSTGRRQTWWQTVFDRRLILGLVAVPAGFVIGNPFAVLDYPTFSSDFLYNYTVAPVYTGQVGHSYGDFFLDLAQLIGPPSFLLFLVANAASLCLVIGRQTPRRARATFWLSLSVLAVYYAQFAPFPRLESRFVLPVVPFWLLLSGPFWTWAQPRVRSFAPLLLALLAYNLVCSYAVGARFLDDPRISAEAWIRENTPPERSIEADAYSPTPGRGPGLQLQAASMPFVSGRERLYDELFRGDSRITGRDGGGRKFEAMLAWYTPDELRRRNPDLIAVSSLYYQRFLPPDQRSALYPSMRDYFESLLAERYPYQIVFDRRTSPVPPWLYPREIDFLDNRVTILARTDRAR
jgi:hypothetical protein